MYFNLKDLINKYCLEINGVVHIGAHECEELSLYLENNIPLHKQLWIEAIEEKVNLVKQKIPNINIINVLLTDKEGETVTFNITNNYQSSTIFNFKEHLNYYPETQIVKKVEMKTSTLNNIFKQYNFYNKYNFMVIKAQGAELPILKGTREILSEFKYLYIKTIEEELYENSPNFEQINQFICSNGFCLKEKHVYSTGWGEAFYIKTSVS